MRGVDLRLSLFGTLKSEFSYLNKFVSLDCLKAELKAYIHYCNHGRIKRKQKWVSMKKSRYNDEQIVRTLRETDQSGGEG